MAKTRVAPIKSVSIPRLEMEAALIGARMSKFIRDGLDLPIKRTVLWSDSKNVLCWIRANDAQRFKMYIAHRIGEILDLTEKSDWRWVPTKENVADDGTRDVIPADISKESRWIRGSQFLWEPESQWPAEADQLLGSINTEDLEMKKERCMVILETEDLIQVENYSSWERLARVTAWVLRGAKIFKREAIVSNLRRLSVGEFRSATKYWIQKVQEECYLDEISNLKEGKTVNRSSKIASLWPILVDGVICVDTRLVNSPSMSRNGIYSIILEKNHPWTILLMDYYHRIFGHHGVDLIFNELRQRYWITGGKAAVKKIARNCLQCQLENARQVPPAMAALPEVRVTKPSRPFTFVGVDFFGPMEVVNGRKREKRYGALFTCLSTRAVHLEMVYSLSTDDFIMAFMRFICRRGEPDEIWSDNGTNFKGAEAELKKAVKEMDQDRVADSLSMRGVNWKYIPPGSPHFGGAWERLVRSVKTALTTILKNRTLSDQLLLTVLAEAESSVNSRPLTTVSNDKDDAEAITPNCFLIGTTSIKQLPGVFNDSDMCLKKRWRQGQVLANHFWKRWLKEYLPSLSLRTKWNRETPEIKVGELVFVPDANQVRNQWTKGVVQSVLPGKDGRIRVVEVKTVTGVYKKAVANLYRIPGWNQDRDSG